MESDYINTSYYCFDGCGDNQNGYDDLYFGDAPVKPKIITSGYYILAAGIKIFGNEIVFE